jgi:CheY-like chemotaxis protein
MNHDDTILIVEDDDDIRASLAALLASEGYDVVEARNGEDGLRALRSGRHFCLVLLDLFMPVKNGWDFRSEQLEDPAVCDVPVVIISADSAARQAAAKLGAIGWMVKPIDFDALLGTVATYC